jgi:predicted MFS family arabinose efflux permease
MTLAFIFGMMTQVGGIAHLFSLVAGRTGSDDAAALALAVMAGASVVGRLIGGWALSYISSRGFVIGLTIGQGVVLILLAFAESTAGLVASSLLFGLTVGNLLMMAPLLSAEAFGLKAYGRIFSINQLCNVVGVAAGPVVMGQLYARAGGYHAAFLAMAMASGIAFILICAAGPVRALLEERQT